MSRRYLINELFYSLQGEGVRAGIPHIFIRFAKCNLACSTATVGWDCDTDFDTGVWATLDEVADAVDRAGTASWVLLTGGEPALQADQTLVSMLQLRLGKKVAIETNGTMPVPGSTDWVCVSPKNHPIVLSRADEIKFVLAAGQEPAVPDGIDADHHLISPAFKGDEPDPDAMVWCIQWVLEHPGWRLSCQQHKWWGVR